MYDLNNEPAHEPKLMVNYTGEPVQPTRLYYRILNQKTLVRSLNKLRCVEYIPWLDVWQWLYEAEAKKIRFAQSYNKIPKEERPIALGFFAIRGDDLILDARSPDRALEAIKFFDRRVNRRAAEVYKMRLVNRFFDGASEREREDAETPYDRFFDERDAEVSLPKGEQMAADIEAIKAQYEDEAEQKQAINDYFEKDMAQPSPELEELPIHFYEEGLVGLEMGLHMRYAEAEARWEGEPFSRSDFIDMMAGMLAERMTGEEWEEDEEA